MKFQLSSVVLSTLLFGSTLADRQYKSRPDLSPPRFNITVPATSEVDKGFIFTTPYSSLVSKNSGPEQQAAYIFTDTGDLVWSSLGILSGFVANFQVAKYKGQEILSIFQGTIDLFHGHGFGHPSILNNTYGLVTDLRGGNHRILDLHEFTIVDEKTALVEIYKPTIADLSSFGANETQNWIVDGVFQGKWATFKLF